MLSVMWGGEGVGECDVERGRVCSGEGEGRKRRHRYKEEYPSVNIYML